jgi:hypothetical protein
MNLRLRIIPRKKYGNLTTIRRAGSKNGHPLWLCRCDCGIVKSIDGPAVYKGTTKSCGCSRYIKPYESLYNYCMFHAKRERPELEHTLTLKQFLKFTKTSQCHYCGAAVEFAKRNINGKRAVRYNLDRKNNNKGYCAANLVVCCKLCNYTKGNRFTYKQFLEIGRVIRSFHES